MAGQIMEAMSGEAPRAPGDRVRLVVRAVAGSYGGRDRVHRLLMAHALTRAPGQRLSPLYAKLMDLFTSDGVTGPDQVASTMTPAQAFVLTHAMAGVLRTLAASDDTPPLQEVEDALVRLVIGFVAAP